MIATLVEQEEFSDIDFGICPFAFHHQSRLVEEFAISQWGDEWWKTTCKMSFGWLYAALQPLALARHDRLSATQYLQDWSNLRMQRDEEESVQEDEEFDDIDFGVMPGVDKELWKRWHRVDQTLTVDELKRLLQLHDEMVQDFYDDPMTDVMGAPSEDFQNAFDMRRRRIVRELVHMTGTDPFDWEYDPPHESVQEDVDLDTKKLQWQILHRAASNFSDVIQRGGGDPLDSAETRIHVLDVARQIGIPAVVATQIAQDLSASLSTTFENPYILLLWQNLPEEHKQRARGYAGRYRVERGVQEDEEFDDIDFGNRRDANPYQYVLAAFADSTLARFVEMLQYVWDMIAGDALQAIRYSSVAVRAGHVVDFLLDYAEEAKDDYPEEYDWWQVLSFDRKKAVAFKVALDYGYGMLTGEEESVQEDEEFDDIDFGDHNEIHELQSFAKQFDDVVAYTKITHDYPDVFLRIKFRNRSWISAWQSPHSGIWRAELIPSHMTSYGAWVRSGDLDRMKQAITHEVEKIRQSEGLAEEEFDDIDFGNASMVCREFAKYARKTVYVKSAQAVEERHPDEDPLYGVEIVFSDDTEVKVWQSGDDEWLMEYSYDREEEFGSYERMINLFREEMHRVQQVEWDAQHESLDEEEFDDIDFGERDDIEDLISWVRSNQRFANVVTRVRVRRGRPGYGVLGLSSTTLFIDLKDGSDIAIRSSKHGFNAELYLPSATSHGWSEFGNLDHMKRVLTHAVEKVRQFGESEEFDDIDFGIDQDELQLRSELEALERWLGSVRRYEYDDVIRSVRRSTVYPSTSLIVSFNGHPWPFIVITGITTTGGIDWKGVIRTPLTSGNQSRAYGWGSRRGLKEWLLDEFKRRRKEIREPRESLDEEEFDDIDFGDPHGLLDKKLWQRWHRTDPTLTVDELKWLLHLHDELVGDTRAYLATASVDLGRQYQLSFDLHRDRIVHELEQAMRVGESLDEEETLRRHQREEGLSEGIFHDLKHIYGAHADRRDPDPLTLNRALEFMERFLKEEIDRSENSANDPTSPKWMKKTLDDLLPQYYSVLKQVEKARSEGGIRNAVIAVDQALNLGHVFGSVVDNLIIISGGDPSNEWEDLSAFLVSIGRRPKMVNSFDLLDRGASREEVSALFKQYDLDLDRMRKELEAESLSEGRFHISKGAEPVEVWDNPTESQLEALIRRSAFGRVRGIVDRDGSAFFWDASEGTHAGIQEFLTDDQNPIRLQGWVDTDGKLSLVTFTDRDQQKLEELMLKYSHLQRMGLFYAGDLSQWESGEFDDIDFGHPITTDRVEIVKNVLRNAGFWWLNVQTDPPPLGVYVKVMSEDAVAVYALLRREFGEHRIQRVSSRASVIDFVGMEESLDEGKSFTLEVQNRPVRIIRNPSRNILEALTRRTTYMQMRGLADDTDIYFWDAFDANHYQVEPLILDDENSEHFWAMAYDDGTFDVQFVPKGWVQDTHKKFNPNVKALEPLTAYNLEVPEALDEEEFDDIDFGGGFEYEVEAVRNLLRPLTIDVEEVEGWSISNEGDLELIFELKDGNRVYANAHRKTDAQSVTRVEWWIEAEGPAEDARPEDEPFGVYSGDLSAAFDFLQSLISRVGANESFSEEEFDDIDFGTPLDDDYEKLIRLIDEPDFKDAIDDRDIEADDMDVEVIYVFFRDGSRARIWPESNGRRWFLRNTSPSGEIVRTAGGSVEHVSHSLMWIIAKVMRGMNEGELEFDDVEYDSVLDEEEWTAARVKSFGSDKQIKVLVNPTRDELDGYVNATQHGYARGLADDTDTYFWNAFDAVHLSVRSQVTSDSDPVYLNAGFTGGQLWIHPRGDGANPTSKSSNTSLENLLTLEEYHWFTLHRKPRESLDGEEFDDIDFGDELIHLRIDIEKFLADKGWTSDLVYVVRFEQHTSPTIAVEPAFFIEDEEEGMEEKWWALLDELEEKFRSSNPRRLRDMLLFSPYANESLDEEEFDDIDFGEPLPPSFSPDNPITPPTDFLPNYERSNLVPVKKMETDAEIDLLMGYMGFEDAEEFEVFTGEDPYGAFGQTFVRVTEGEFGLSEEDRFPVGELEVLDYRMTAGLISDIGFYEVFNDEHLILKDENGALFTTNDAFT